MTTPRTTTDLLIAQANALQTIESGVPGAPPIAQGLLGIAASLPPGAPLPGATGGPIIPIPGGVGGPAGGFQSLLASLSPGAFPGPLNAGNQIITAMGPPGYARTGLG